MSARTCLMCHICVTIFQVVEIPSLKVTKKIKSMQIFRKPVQTAMQVWIHTCNYTHCMCTYNYMHKYTHIYCSLVITQW